MLLENKPLNLQTNCKTTLQIYLKMFIKQKKMRKNLLLTPKEMERKALHSQIIAEVRTLRERYTEASPWRVFAEVARKHSMTSMGVMKICQRNGNYKTRTEK